MKHASNNAVAATTVGNATPSRQSVAEHEPRRYNREAARERAEAERERREIRRELRAAGVL